MVEPTSETAKIQSLEGLRGLMAWWVVLGHVSLSVGWKLPLVDNNGLAVEVFIFLSGFVIARLIDRKAERYGQYITRRAFRIFPLYLLVLTVSAALLPLQVSAWESIPFKTSLNASRLQLALQAVGDLPTHFAIHLPLAQGLVPNGPLSSVVYTIVGQAWSISLEWQFYIVAPFVMWTLGAKRRWLLALLTTVGLLLTAHAFSDAYLGARVLQFGIGICSYLALDRKEKRLLWSIAAALFCAATIKRFGLVECIPLGIWVLVLLSAVALPHQRRRFLANGLSSRIAVHLGELSYSVYLVHMIPLYLSVWFLQRLGTSGWPLKLGILISTVGLAYLISRATYSFIEKPGIKLGSRITSGWQGS